MTNHDHRDRSESSVQEFAVGHIATGRRPIPNVNVITHVGKNKLFYSDLVRDRTVIVNFFSTSHESKYAVMPSLARLARVLGDRLGREVFMLSVTADPARDTTHRLRTLARQFGVPDGWSLITGDPHSIHSIHSAMFVHSDGHQVQQHGSHSSRAAGAESEHRDCSMGLMRYGNDATGFWGSVPAKADPKLIIERLSWIRVRQPNDPSQPLRLKRKGPFPIAAIR
jgi:protein SCO1/2